MSAKSTAKPLKRFTIKVLGRDAHAMLKRVVYYSYKDFASDQKNNHFNYQLASEGKMLHGVDLVVELERPEAKEHSPE